MDPFKLHDKQSETNNPNMAYLTVPKASDALNMSSGKFGSLYCQMDVNGVDQNQLPDHDHLCAIGIIGVINRLAHSVRVDLGVLDVEDTTIR